MIGENATQMEYESAEAIAANLENLTGNKPKIYISKKTESLKYTYNLIILGTPNSNKVLKKVCKMANATMVTDEYPGEDRGVLEILRNPWNEDKAMLLVEGSDEWGVKAAASKLDHPQQLIGDTIVVNGKVSGLLYNQIELRKKQTTDPRADRLEQMNASGMSVENLDIQRIYIYFTEKPNTTHVEELKDMGIDLYLDSWIPPVGNHPAGFLLADMPMDKLDELASKSYVVRLDTAERVHEPLTNPGDEENTKIVYQGGL